MQQLGYKKTLESKIIRVKHRITFAVGISATSLMNYLKSVPVNAKITDIGEGCVNEDGEKEFPFIEFEEEKLNVE